MDMWNQTTTSAMEQREMRQVPQKESTIEALLHRKCNTIKFEFLEIELKWFNWEFCAHENTGK